MSVVVQYYRLDQVHRNTLLHSGTDARALRASVKIKFDNSDRRFPIDKDEFSVSREIRLKEDTFMIDGKKGRSIY